MGVVQNYNVGGVIDEVKKINWPARLFPQFTKPFVKGLRIDVPALIGTYEVGYILAQDMELINVALACSGYKDGDYWECTTQAPGEDEYTVVETMATRELAESSTWGTCCISYISCQRILSSVLSSLTNPAQVKSCGQV